MRRGPAGPKEPGLLPGLRHLALGLLLLAGCVVRRALCVGRRIDWRARLAAA